MVEQTKRTPGSDRRQAMKTTGWYVVTAPIPGLPQYPVGSRIYLNEGRNGLVWHVWLSLVDVPDGCVGLEEALCKG